MAPSSSLNISIPNSYRRWIGPVGILLLILFAIFYPKQVDKQNIWTIFFVICLQISLSQSWNMLAGFAGQTNLGHAAFFGIGALIARTLWFKEIPLALAIFAGGLASAAFGMLIGAPTFRLRGTYFAIGTLAVAEALRITIAQNVPLISSMSGAMIASYDVSARYYLALGLAIVTTLAAYLLLRSPWGLGILAVREDEEAAQAMGVNIVQHKLLALGVGSFFTGLAGGVYAYQQISYYQFQLFGAQWTFDTLLITFVGGIGTIAGPIVGSIFFVLVRERLARNFVQIHQVIFGVLFILIVLLLPGGLVEIWDRIKNYFSRKENKNVKVERKPKVRKLSK